MQHFLGSIPEVLKNFEGNEAANEAFVISVWKKIVGESLAEHAVPVLLVKKRLIVAVASETWRKQMADLADQMVFKLNSTFGLSLVSFIEFRIDAKVVREHRRKIEAGHISDAEWDVLVKNEVTPELRNAAEAKRMLKLLSGRWHEVLTGIAVVQNGDSRVGLQRTRVKFAEMSDAEWESLWASLTYGVK